MRFVFTSNPPPFHYVRTYAAGPFVDRRSVSSTSRPTTGQRLETHESWQAIGADHPEVPCGAIAEGISRGDRSLRAFRFLRGSS